MGAEPETKRLKEIGSRLARSSLSLTRYIATAGPGLGALFVSRAPAAPRFAVNIPPRRHGCTGAGRRRKLAGSAR